MNNIKQDIPDRIANIIVIIYRAFIDPVFIDEGRGVEFNTLLSSIANQIKYARAAMCNTKLNKVYQTAIKFKIGIFFIILIII